MGSAARELLAARADVWAFLAEPHHLADWWPGIVGVEPDRRGFADGARWQVARAVEQTVLVGFAGRLPSSGRSARSVTETLVITRVDPYERWAWELVGRGKACASCDGPRRGPPRVARRRAARGSRSPSRRRRSPLDAERRASARTAADRLYDLVQTAASL